MNEVTDLSKSISIIGGADGPTSVFIAGKVNIGVIVAGIVIGLILCFLGLKLAKAVAALLGFMIGASAGAAIATAVGVGGGAFVAITIVSAIVLAVVSFFVYRIGVFLMSFICSMGMLITLFENTSIVLTVIMIVVSVILAVLAVIFVEPVIIIITGAFGGLMAGPLILQLAGIGEPAWIGYVVGALLAIIGMGIQFMMHSRKIGKKEKMKSESIKENVSMENEVEKARMILDEEDENKENEEED